MKTTIMLLAGIALLSLAFADVGPSPPGPDVTVYLKRGGSPCASVDHLVYHCNGTNSTATGAVEIQTLNFTCSLGTCTSGWYYKFNPCFRSSGYFTYSLHGKAMKTDWFNFTEAKSYVITVDADTGKTLDSGSAPKPSLCGSAFLVPLFLGAAFVLGRK